MCNINSVRTSIRDQSNSPAIAVSFSTSANESIMDVHRCFHSRRSEHARWSKWSYGLLDYTPQQQQQLPLRHSWHSAHATRSKCRPPQKKWNNQKWATMQRKTQQSLHKSQRCRNICNAFLAAIRTYTHTIEQRTDAGASAAHTGGGGVRMWLRGVAIALKIAAAWHSCAHLFIYAQCTLRTMWHTGTLCNTTCIQCLYLFWITATQTGRHKRADARVHTTNDEWATANTNKYYGDRTKPFPPRRGHSKQTKLPQTGMPFTETHEQKYAHNANKYAVLQKKVKFRQRRLCLLSAKFFIN